MPRERVINTARSADLVTTKILVNGEELSDTIQVLSIVVEKEINRIPTARIVVADGDPSTQDFAVSNNTFFVPGNEIEITAGYHNTEELIFKGIVIKHNMKIRPENSQIIAECKDVAVKMTIGRKSKYFIDKKDSEIIEEIIARYSIENEVESTSVQHRELVQYYVTDWDFCVTRAQVNGKICLVDNGKINIKSPGHEKEAVETVAFGASLLNFDAEIDAQNQFDKITGYGWDPATQEMQEIQANPPSVNLNGNITVSDLSRVHGLEDFSLKNGGQATSGELQHWADARSLFAQLSKTRGRAKFQGTAVVKPDTVIELQGVGDRFNGKVYVSGVRHQISNGDWTTDAQFGVDPRWFTETANISALPASGLLAAVSGLQVGIVAQLENDPDGEDRILVKLPVVDSDGEGTWARVATLDAGNKRGSFFRPEIADEVIVGFINDNPSDAVVLGMMNSSAKPAPLLAKDDNHEKGFFTRSEMKFVFNDDKKSVVLETPAGKKISVDEDEGVIKIEDENSNKVTINSSGITMESTKEINIKTTGDVTIEGKNISLKASVQFKSEGSAGAEIYSGGPTTVKGSIVQIN